MNKQSAPWLPVICVFAVNILFAAGLYSHAFLYNFYLLELGLRERVLGHAAAALTLGGLLGLWPAGWLVDRRGARFAYVAAGLLLALGLGIGAFARGLSVIYAAALIAGAGTAAWRVAMGPMLMALTSNTTRARAFSNNVALLVGSGALWTLVFGAAPGWLAAQTGTSRLAATQATLLIGALGSLVGVALIGTLRNARPTPALTPSAPKLRQPRAVPVQLIGLAAAIALWMSASGLVIPFLNLYFHREHGLPVERVAALFAVTQVVVAGVIFLSGEVATRLGAQRPLLFWTLLFAPLLWLLAGATSLWLAGALYVLQSVIAPASNALIDQSLMERTPEQQRGRVSTWRNAATEGSGFAGASLGGRLLEIGFGPLLGVAGTVALLGAIVLNLVLRAWQPPPSAQPESPAQQPVEPLAVD